MENKGEPYILLILFTWLFAAWAWYQKLMSARPQPVGLTILAALFTAYSGYRLWFLKKELRNLHLAERGERRVAEELRRLRDFDFVTFDDLLLDNVNVDHVVVGPGGVFAVETKTYSLFGTRMAHIGGDGILYLSGNEAFKDPLKQARSSAALVSADLKRHMQRDIWVNPVVVLPGWRIEPSKMETIVALLNEELLSEFFKSKQAMLTNAEIRDICSHLDRTARS